MSVFNCTVDYCTKWFTLILNLVTCLTSISNVEIFSLDSNMEQD
jgi:hypothetical protein